MTVSGKWTDLEIDITKEGLSLVRPMNQRIQAEFGGKKYQSLEFFMVQMIFILIHSISINSFESPTLFG
jgi:hypothetical protein